MFQEYPKALYKGDSYHVVAGTVEEEAARADGWRYFGEQVAAEPDAPGTQAAAVPAKRGRKPAQPAAAEE